MLYFNHKKCTRYFKSFILNLFEIEILNDESLYRMCRVFSCLFYVIRHIPALSAVTCGTLQIRTSTDHWHKLPFSVRRKKRRYDSRRILSSLFYFLIFSVLYVLYIFKNIAEIKGSKVILRSLCAADHLNAAVLFQKKLCAL